MVLETNKKQLGRRLKLARENKGWSQIYVAKLLNGVTSQALSNYERGERDPDTALLRQLAQLYEVSVDWLLDSTNNPKLPDPSIPSWWNRNTPPTNVELEEFLKNANIYFDGAPLDEEDKEDIMTYLSVKWERERRKREKEGR